MPVPADPWSSAALGLGQGLGSAIGGGGGPFIGGGSEAAAYGTTLNGAGWNVNLGSGSQIASASPSNSTTTPDIYRPQQAGVSVAVIAAVAVVGLIVWRLRKKRGA